MSLENIPRDVIALILLYVEWEDLESIRIVCKQWNGCTRDPLWRSEFIKKSIRWNPEQTQPGWRIEGGRTLIQETQPGIRWQTAKSYAGFSRGLHFLQFRIGDRFSYGRIGLVDEEYDVTKINDTMTCIGGEQGQKLASSWCFHCLGPIYAIGKPTQNSDIKWQAKDVIGMMIQFSRSGFNNDATVSFFHNAKYVNKITITKTKDLRLFPAVSFCDGPNEVTVEETAVPGYARPYLNKSN